MPQAAALARDTGVMLHTYPAGTAADFAGGHAGFGYRPGRWATDPGRTGRDGRSDHAA
jgi:hypothetical protein